MFIRSALCGTCQKHLPVTPGFNPCRFPPYEIECKHCHNRMKTSFSHRMTWLSWLIWGDFWILCTLSLIVLAIVEKYSIFKAVAVISFGSTVGGIGGGFIVCIIFPFPLQIVIDLLHFILIKSNIIKERKPKDLDALDV